MSSKIFLVIIILFLHIPEISPARKISSLESFEDATNILEEVCDGNKLCGGTSAITERPCCGDCMCAAQDCLETGTCCLDMYINFTHLRFVSENKRYSCLPSQYLEYKDTQFSTNLAFLLVTACDRANRNTDTSYLCETPGTDLETVVPVTEPITNIGYKNKYCAYCNNVEISTQLIGWKLRITSNQHISLPHHDLLEEIRKTRGNIMFIPPDYVKAAECVIDLRYTISTCNQTGRWKEHNALIEEACETPYIDPFNNTYKNLFCFLCNEEKSVIDEDWICHKPFQKYPGFSATYDLKVIMYGDNTDRLVCSDTQFADEKMKVCRNILCPGDRKLFWGGCKPIYIETFNSTCTSVFMKLTPLQHGTSSKLNQFDKNVLKWEIQDKLETLSEGKEHQFSETAQDVKLFTKENDKGQSEYFVVYIVSLLNRALTADQLLNDVILVTESDVRFGTLDIGKYSAEMSSYELIVSDLTATLLVPNEVDNSFDELSENLTSTKENICFDKEKVPLIKLFNCPYIKLNITEIPMRLELGFLLIFDKFGKHKLIRKFFRWEYERHENTIKICFKDYMIINNAMTITASSAPHISFLDYAYLYLSQSPSLFIWLYFT